MKFLPLLGLTVSLAENCPSDECWSYDEEKSACMFKEDSGCSQLMCTGSGFEIAFGNSLFGIGGALGIIDGPVNWGSEINPVLVFDPNGPSQWHAKVPFGTGGSTYTINDETNEIAFHVWISLGGDDRRRSDLPAGKIIDLGHDLDVYTTPNSVNVKYTCIYPMTFTLASQSYGFHHVAASGSNIGYGGMESGFEMALYGRTGGENARFVMGSDMVVKVHWKAGLNLPKLWFYYEECNVHHGSVTVSVIKEGCYASVVGAHPIPSFGKTVSFSWKVFKGMGEQESTQALTCSMRICKEGKCPWPVSNADCPVPITQGFIYTIDGHHYDHHHYAHL